MRVQCVRDRARSAVAVELLGDADQPIAEVVGFLHHLRARGYSSTTLAAYAYDRLHFLRFLTQQDLTYAAFTPARALAFLEYLHTVRPRRPAHRLESRHADTVIPSLAATTINRMLAAVSSLAQLYK